MAARAAANAGDTGRREAREERRERYSPRHDRWRAYAAAREAAAREGAQRRAPATGWNGACEELAAVLRKWPVREIERDVRLSSPQRVAFYELVTASLKAADTLDSACSAEAALTPVGRMETAPGRLCSSAPLNEPCLQRCAHRRRQRYATHAKTPSQRRLRVVAAQRPHNVACNPLTVRQP